MFLKESKVHGFQWQSIQRVDFIVEIREVREFLESLLALKSLRLKKCQCQFLERKDYFGPSIHYTYVPMVASPVQDYIASLIRMEMMF